MLTNKRKLRNQKQFLFKVSFLASVVFVGIVGGYFASVALFHQESYLSPLSQEVITGIRDEDEQVIALIREQIGSDEKNIESITREGNTYKIVLKTGGEIILSSEKDIKTQISSLQFILQRLTMEGRRFTRLDLSFDKPIIVLDK